MRFGRRSSDGGCGRSAPGIAADAERPDSSGPAPHPSASAVPPSPQPDPPALPQRNLAHLIPFPPISGRDGGTTASASSSPLQPFSAPRSYQASLNPFISTATIIRCPCPCLPTDSSRGASTYWSSPGRRASRGERRAPCAEPGHGRPPRPRSRGEARRAPRSSSSGSDGSSAGGWG